MKMKYNDNIILLKSVAETERLEENEYFVLMVEDQWNKDVRPASDYWDYENGFVGLERTDRRIYISKNFRARCNPGRGKTFITEVQDIKKCCLLS